jgi:NAD(P)-dependent dehydrogenase (short-subunit alcohol dehydrogenase family)
MIGLDGRAFVVLGAGAGIGSATSRALAGAGAHVLCVDREPALAEAIAAEVNGVAFAADVTRRVEMEAVFEAARERLSSPVTGLVDIVGISTYGSLTQISDETWDGQFDSVLRHAYLAIQLGGNAIAQNGGGTMVFIGSLSGTLSISHRGAYGTAKAALHHLVRTAAHDLGSRNVRVNAVAPGLVRTPRLVEKFDEETWDKIERAIPLGRTATPEDVANAILFLASEMSSVISGAVIPIDGALGVVASLPEFT